MFEGLLENILLKNLGQFVNFDKESLKVGIWSGKLELSNVSLKPSALDVLELPISVKAGFIKSLSVSIPWSSLWSSEVVVQVDGVYLIATPVSNDNQGISHEDAKGFARSVKQSQIRNAQSIREMKKANNESQGSASSGMIENLIKTIINNVQVTVRNVHFRFEDHTHPYVKTSRFAVGISINELFARTTNSEGVVEFQKSQDTPVIFKSVQLSGACMYWDMNASWFKEDPSHFFRTAVTGRDHQYVVHPFSVFSNISLNNDLTNTNVPKVSTKLSMKSLTIGVNRQQWKCMMHLLNRLSEMKIKADLLIGFQNITDDMPSFDSISNAKQRWKYAVSCVKAYNFSKRRLKLSWRYILKQCQYRKEYISLYLQCIQGKAEFSNSRILKLEDMLEVDMVMMYRRLAEKEADQASLKKQKANNAASGMFSYFFGSSPEESKSSDWSLSEDERNELYRTFDIGDALTEHKLPPKFVNLKICIDIKNVSIQLSSHSQVLANFRVGSSVEFKNFADESMVVSFGLSRFALTDESENAREKIICQVSTDMDSHFAGNILNLEYRTFPHQAEERRRTLIKVSSVHTLEFRYCVSWVESLLKFFDTSSKATETEFLSIAARSWQQEQQSKFLKSLNDHPFYDIEVELGHFLLAAPHPSYKECILLCVDGINIYSFKPSVGRPSIQISPDSLSPPIDNQFDYDGFQLQISNLSVRISPYVTTTLMDAKENYRLLDNVSAFVTLYTLVGDPIVEASNCVTAVLVDLKCTSVAFTSNVASITTLTDSLVFSIPNIPTNSQQLKERSPDLLFADHADILSEKVSSVCCQVTADSFAFDIFCESHLVLPHFDSLRKPLSCKDLDIISLQMGELCLSLDKYSHSLDVDLVLKSILIEDRFQGMTYPGQEKGTLVSSFPQHNENHDSETSEDLIKLTIRFEDNPDESTSTSIEVDIGVISLSWNPETCRALMALVSALGNTSSAEVTEPTFRQIETSSRAPLSAKNQLHCQCNLMSVAINLNENGNKKSRLFRGEVNSLGLSYHGTGESFVFSGFLGDVQFLDCSLPTGHKYQKLIGTKQKGKDDSLPVKVLDVSLETFLNTDRTSPPGCDASIKLYAGSIEAIVFVPVIQQLLDYVQDGILSSLVQYSKQKATESASVAIQNIDSSKFYQLLIHIDSPAIILPESRSHDSEIQIRVGDVVLGNKRVSRGDTLLEQIDISVTDSISITCGGSSPVVKGGSLNVCAKRPLQNCELEFDFDISVSMQDILQIQFSSEDVQQAQRILVSNFEHSPASELNPEIHPEESKSSSLAENNPSMRVSLDCKGMCVLLRKWLPSSEFVDIGSLSIAKIQLAYTANKQESRIKFELGSLFFRNLLPAESNRTWPYLICSNEQLAENHPIELPEIQEVPAILSGFALFQPQSSIEMQIEVQDINIILIPRILHELSIFGNDSLVSPTNEQSNPQKVQSNIADSSVSMKVLLSHFRIISPNLEVLSSTNSMVLPAHIQLDFSRDISEGCLKESVQLLLSDLHIFLSPKSSILEQCVSFIISPTTAVLLDKKLLNVSGETVRSSSLDVHRIQTVVHWTDLKVLEHIAKGFGCLLDSKPDSKPTDGCVGAKSSDISQEWNVLSSIEDLTLIVIDDCGNRIRPFISLCIPCFRGGARLSDPTFEFHSTTQIQMSFFNPFIFSWEPVLEPCFASFELARAPLDQNEDCVQGFSTAVSCTLEGIKSAETQPRPAVNITLASRFLESASHTISRWSADYSKNARAASKIRMKSLFVVRNFCGTDVEFSSNGGNSYNHIPSGGTFNLDIVSSTVNVLGDASKKFLWIKISQSDIWPILKDVCVSTNGRFTFPITSQRDASVTIHLTVDCSMREDVQLVTLSSHLIFENMISQNVEISLSPSETKQSCVIESLLQMSTFPEIDDNHAILPMLSPSGTTSIPLCLRNWDNVSFRVFNHCTPSKPISIDTIMNSDASIPLEFHPIKKGDPRMFTSIQSIVTKETGHFQKFIIFDPIVVFNMLPVDISCFIRNSTGDIICVKVSSGKKLPVNQLDPNLSQFELNISVDGYGKSSIISLPCRTAYSGILPLKHGSIHVLDVSIASERNLDISDGLIFSLFCPIWILDRTNLDLEVGTSNGSSDEVVSISRSGEDLKEVIWENERNNLFKWSPPFLPTDPSHFHSESMGDIESIDSFLLQENAKWAQDSWKVSFLKESDSDGWVYAFDFNKVFSTRKAGFSHVRRRKWTRMRLTTSDQQKSLLLYGGDDKKTLVSCRTLHSPWSNPISIAADITGSLRMVDNRSDQVFEILPVVESAPFPFSRSRMIIFYPYFVICNETDKDICLQQSPTNSKMVISPKQKVPFFFDRENSSRAVALSTETSSLSSFFKIDVFSQFFVKAIIPATNEYLYFNILVASASSCVAVVIEKSSANDIPYQIDNRSSLFIRYSQLGVSNPSVYDVEPETQNPFVWDDLSEEGSLYLNVYFGKSSRPLQVPLDEVGYNKIVKIAKVSLRILIFVENESKVLRFQPVEANVPSVVSKKSSDVDTVSFEFRLNIPALGISIVSQKPREIAYLYLDEILSKYTLSADSRKAHLSIGMVQVDNTDDSYNTPFPAVLSTASDFKLPFVQVRLFEFLGHSNVKYYEYFGFLLQDFSLNIDDRFLLGLISFLSESTIQSIENNDEHLVLQDLFEYSQSVPSVDVSSLRDLSKQMIFFDILELYPIKFVFNFFSTGAMASGFVPRILPLQVAMKTLGAVTMNIKESHFSIAGKKMTQAYISEGVLFQNLIAHFKRQILSISLSVLGSAQFLGNPVGLFHNVGSGVSDFLSEPAEGFRKGPAEFGLGIAKGSASLLKHSVHGVGNTVAGITGTVGGALANLAFDEKYSADREAAQMRDKPQNALDGTVNAGKQIGQGFLNGLSGLISAPVKGAQHGGVGGFFKGIARGTIGLAVKPMTGIVDAATSVVEGFKNTANLKAKYSSVWIRDPRMIYSVDKKIRIYDPVDAKMNTIIQIAKNTTHSIFPEDGAYEFCVPQGNNAVIGFSNNIVCIKISDKIPVVWRKSWHSVEVSIDGRNIFISDRNGKETLVFDNESKSKHFISLIKGFLQQSRLQ